MDYNRSGPKKTPCLTDNCGLLWSLWWTYHGRKIAHKQNKNQLSTTSNATLTTDVIVHSNRWETKATATRKWAWDGNCWIFEWRMTGRVHYPRPSVEFFIDSSTASRSISPTSAAYVKLAENFAERWAELRLVESVNQRIENNGRLGKKSRDGCRQGRLPLHLAVIVEWAKLTDESDNNVWFRCSRNGKTVVLKCTLPSLVKINRVMSLADRMMNRKMAK